MSTTCCVLFSYLFYNITLKLKYKLWFKFPAKKKVAFNSLVKMLLWN